MVNTVDNSDSHTYLFAAVAQPYYISAFKPSSQ